MASGGSAVPGKDWRHEHLAKCSAGDTPCETVDMSTPYWPGDILHNSNRFWFIIDADDENEEYYTLFTSSTVSDPDNNYYLHDRDELTVYGGKWRVWRA